MPKVLQIHLRNLPNDIFGKAVALSERDSIWSWCNHPEGHPVG